MFRHLTTLTFILLLFFPGSNTRADSGRYCGIYAIYGAASTLGVHGEFEELVNEKCVSSLAGSSSTDLIDAAELLGVHATPFNSLGASSLYGSRDPLVLHVSSMGQLDAYNHWLLFLGTEGGAARVVDSRDGIYLMSMSELLARWDGFAIAVSKEETPVTAFGSVELALVCWRALLVLSLTGGLARGATNFVPLQCLVKTPIILGTIVIATIVLATETLSTASLLKNSDCAQLVHAASGDLEFPILSTADVARLRQERSELLIFDTRYESDYGYGHLPGAISVPVDISQSRLTTQLSGIDRNQPVILYCQSKGCKFSDRIAVALTGFGFTDVRIYKDGWVGWSEFHRANSQEPKGND